MTNTDITIAPHTSAHSFVWTSEAIERELSDELSFIVPGSEYMQRLRKTRWDGRIRVFSRATKLVPTGLVPRVIRWAERKGYTTENRLSTQTSTWTALDTASLIAKHRLPHDVRDYQQEAVTYGLTHQRCVLISPTASGKSLILYLLIKARMSEGPILLIVPTIALVSQMFTDFESYGWTNAKASIHCITGGKPKDTDKPIVVTTWQSVFRQPESWFARYASIFGDECHLFKADSLTGIMSKAPDCAFRVGVTGTLDTAKHNLLMVEGVFGPVYRVAKTVDLQTQGHLTPIIVQGHFLQYTDYDRWFVREHKRKYAEEIDYFVQHPARLRWTVDFTQQLQGNVLVLYQFVEKHGIPLFHAMQDQFGNTRPVYFISGDISGETRERIRALMEQSTHVVLTFGAQQIRCVPTENIPLSNGTTKLAQDVTPDDDVADSWILNMSREAPARGVMTTPPIFS